MYFSIQKLLTKLRLARMDVTIVKTLLKIRRTDLLIIDNFGMKALKAAQQNDFMEIIEDRHARKATIIASQLPVSKWYDVIGNEVIADAILDRIVHTLHRFEINSKFVTNKQGHNKNDWADITEMIGRASPKYAGEDNRKDCF